MKKGLDTVLEIIRLYFSNDYPGSLKKEVQEWLVNGANEEERDAASSILFDGIVDGTPLPDRAARAALRAWKAGRGIAGESRLKREKDMLLHRRLARVAAASIPVAWVIGILFLYSREEGREQFASEQRVGGIPPVMLCSFPVEGKREKVLFPDSSGAWISERGTVTFTGKRVVSLGGEACFEVKREEGMPFVVQTPGLSITVLGTGFNVKAYPGQPETGVTVYKGSVHVQGSTMSRVMQPGERLVYNNVTGEYRLSRIDEKRPGWIQSRLYFEKASLAEVFESIEWYYHVTVERDARLDVSQRVMSRLDGDEELANTLFLLEKLCGDFTCEIIDERVIVRVNEKSL